MLIMPGNDPRYVVGARVQAKAHHVTALAECHRRYGVNAKTKFVNGTVVSVDASTSSSGRRAATLLTVDYELGGGTIKRCQLNSRGIKMIDTESTAGESNEPVTALVNEVVEHVNETINVGAPSVAGMTTQELLDTIESSDEEPETTIAAPAVAATVQQPLLQQLLVLLTMVPLLQLFIMSSGEGHPALNLH